MLRSVSVIVLEPIAVFEFGVAVEVFGVDRTDEGIEPFDFRVCGVEPGRALATKNGDLFTITPQLGLDSVLGTDLVIVAPTLPQADDEYPPEVLEYVREKRRQPFVGQAQEYFLCRLHADAPEPVLDDREFCDYKWIAPAEFKLEWLPEFKKKVYARVLEDFFNVRARDK